MNSRPGGHGPSLPYPSLCLVTDQRVCPANELPGRVQAAVEGGVDIVQLRDKELPGGALLELATSLRAVVAGRALLLINERADVAVASGADGVQLGEAAMDAGIVRRIVGDHAIIGRSVHSVEGAASVAGADFLLVGTMFATRSHPGEEPSGPDLLGRIRSAGVSVPMLGIGGINPDNAGLVMAAGAHGVAVITNVLGSDDPKLAAERLKSAMLDAVSVEQVHNRPAEPAGPRQVAGGIPPI